MDRLVDLEEIRAARGRIAGVAARTGLYRVEAERLRVAGLPVPRCELWIKAESEQPIGSFKLRGAYNCIAQLPPEKLQRGVITYSSGNHAQGVAYAARALGSKAVIVMPENAPAVKIEATRALGAEVVFVGPASSERKAKAEELAAAHGYAVIPPYDHEAIIAGQGTCGLEILEQLGVLEGGAPGRTVVLSPVSGGGLLSGIATAVKLAVEDARADGAAVPEVEVWGVEPEVAADAKESFETKRLVEWTASQTTRTLADGLRTQSLGERNFAQILRYVDGIVTVSEEEIRRAMAAMLMTTELVAEPSGAVTLAGALFREEALPECARVVAVLSGGNIDPALRTQVEQEAGIASGSAAGAV